MSSNQPNPEVMRAVQVAIEAIDENDFLRGFNVLSSVYKNGVPSGSERGLSYYGVCLALVSKKYKPAIDLCRKAIELQFYNGNHYCNLARVYMAAGNRKKSVETIEEGLKRLPDDETLKSYQQKLGVRSRPVVPFLSRDNPLNVALGKARHARKNPKKKK